jgi:hypothetical protein
MAFDVRPANTHITWFLNSGSEEPIVMYGEVVGSPTPENPTPVRYLHIEARCEGIQTITGMANGKIAMLTIIVQENYTFKMDKGFSVNNASFGIVKHNLPTPGSDGKVTIAYTVYPPNTYIKPDNIIDGLVVDIKAPNPVTGVGTIEFIGTKEIAQDLQFSQYKALRSNGFGVDVETPVQGNTQAVFVYYRYTKNKISPIPYFIRGDGVYSNAANIANPYSNGSRLGEKLSNNSYNNTSNNYEVVLGDGEVHYILFDNKYDGAQLILNGGNSSYSLPNLNKWGVVAERVQFNNNNVIQDAIRLYGGNDYIEYTRTAFDKELWLDVQSGYFSDGNNTGYHTHDEYVPYTNTYLVDLSTSKLTINGKGWTTIEQPVSDDYKICYLVKPFYFAEAFNNNWTGKVGSVSGDLWLTAYTGSYDFYFTGNEFSSATFNNFINNTEKCDKVRVYKPYFVYSNGYYLQNQDFWDQKITDETTYAEFIGENWIRSEIAHGYTTSISSYTIGLPVFEYENMTLFDYGFNDTNFDHGFLGNQEEYKHRLGSNYKSVCSYSTAQLIKTINFSDPAEGTIVLSSFNVFKNTYQGHPGVHLMANNVPSRALYDRGALQDPPVYSGKYKYEVFQYYNMKKTNPWTACSVDNLIVGNTYTHDNYAPADMFTTMVDDRLPSNVPILVDDYKQQLDKRSAHFVIVGYEPFVAPPHPGNVHLNIPANAKGPAIKQFIGYLGKNHWGGNIFNENLAEWSPYYYTAHEHHRAGSGWWILASETEDWLQYAPSRAQQRIREVNTGTKIITPYHIFNRFPFRYQSQLGVSVYDPNDRSSRPVLQNGDKNILSLSKYGTPMPSVDNRVKSGDGSYIDRITVGYNTFDFKLREENYGEIYITIRYEQRPCHFMYNGSNRNDNFVNYVNESNIVELQGEVKSYMVNGKLHDHFDQRSESDSYVVDNTGGKTRLKDLIDQPYMD